MKHITFVLSISLLLGFTQTLSQDEWQLDLVQILFRNGVSAPDSLYPNDPIQSDVWEDGLGQLTLVGQKQLYALGKNLRKRYSHFLTSNPHELSVKSTYLDKCMSSALCLLASLYEPDETWEFMPGLKWQPIPVLYRPPHQDKLLRSFTDFAKTTVELLPRIEKKLDIYKEQLKYWTSFSGTTVDNFYQVSKLRKILFTEHISNHTIPDWAWTYWKDLQFLNDFLYKFTFSEHSILMNVGGPLLAQMVKNVIDKITGDGSKEYKMYIYSGQSAHVAGILGALKSFNGMEPPFAATVVMELLKKKIKKHSKNYKYAMRLGYFNETDANFGIGEPQPLKLPGCANICPLENFEDHAKRWNKHSWRLLRTQDL